MRTGWKNRPGVEYDEDDLETVYAEDMEAIREALNDLDLLVYAKIDGSNQPFTGNLNVSKADPEIRLTDTGNGEYTRITKSDTYNEAVRYNRVIVLGSANDQVPTMTSDTTPSGVASASTIRSGVYASYNAFDNSSATRWESSDSTKPQWLKYQFASAKYCTKYTITSNIYGPKDYTFEGSNDDSNWTVLDTQTGIGSYTSGVKKTYALPARVGPYLYYRVYTTDFSGSRENIEEVEIIDEGNTTQETQIWKSQDSDLGNEYGIQTYGDLGGRHVIEGLTTRFNVAGVEKGQLTSTGLTWIDNFKTYFGTASDASIYYDGTNLIINPKVVGSGILDILGILQTDGYNSADGSAGISTTFIDNDGNTITVKNGLIVSKVAP